MNNIATQFFLRVLVASFATVGIEEFLKNFIKTKKTTLYAFLMIFLSVANYLAVELLPPYVIGSILTIGSVQLCYQTLVQSFKAIIKNVSNKIGGE